MKKYKSTVSHCFPLPCLLENLVLLQKFAWFKNLLNTLFEPIAKLAYFLLSQRLIFKFKQFFHSFAKWFNQLHNHMTLMVLIRSHWLLHTLNDERFFGRNLWFIVWCILGWGYCLSVKAEAFFQTYRKVSAFESGTVASQRSGFSETWGIEVTVSRWFCFEIDL